MKALFALLSGLVWLSGFAQVNLVPNGSFEEYYSCPQWIGDFTVADWSKPTWGSSDYFNICSSEELGVPQNIVGFQQPKSGNAYTGIWLSDFIANEYREYIQCQLISSLEAGEKYQVSFYVSLADSAIKACDNIGALLSATPVILENNNNLPFIPQIVSEKDNPITNTFGWVLVADTITAIGGEEYLTIGVFTDNTHTNWTSVNGGWMSEAYYYIDDVSVVKITTTNSIYSLDQKSDISIFPNPTTDYLNVNFDDIYPEKITLYNSMGETLFVKYQLSENIQINVADYQAGIYFLKIEAKENSITKRFFINH